MQPQITNNEMIENNKLIAEFMGSSFEPLPNTNNECFSFLGSWDVIHITDFETGVYAYHSDWNKLMEVVRKIELSYEYSVTICWEHCIISNAGENKDFLRIEKDGETKIEAVYTACVEFIKWYNENK